MGKCRFDPNMINARPWINSIGPVDIRDKRESVKHYVEYMLVRTNQMFKWTGLPDSIPDHVFESMLQGNGHCAIIPENDTYYAVCGQRGGEPDVYYRGTEYVVSNPAVDFKTSYKIDDIVFCRNDHLTKGLIPLCNKYATMLTENDLTLYLYDIVTRAQFLIAAGCDADKLAADNFLSALEAGDIGSVLQHKFTEGIQVQPGATTGSPVLQQLIEYEQYLKASWYNDLGLDCNYNMKRESLTAGEIDTNSDALLPLIDDMYACRKEICDDAKRVYGLDLTVEYNSSWLDNQEQVKAGPEEKTDEKEGSENDPTD